MLEICSEFTPNHFFQINREKLQINELVCFKLNKLHKNPVQFNHGNQLGSWCASMINEKAFFQSV